MIVPGESMPSGAPVIPSVEGLDSERTRFQVLMYGNLGHWLPLAA